MFAAKSRIYNQRKAIKTMMVEFKGRKCKIYNDAKQILRQINVSNEIVNAQVSGSGNSAVISITMKNGKCVLYKGTGQLLRG